MLCPNFRLGEGEIGQGLALDMHLVRLAAARRPGVQLEIQETVRTMDWLKGQSTGNHDFYHQI
jgi:hypothetical protein